MLQKKLDHYILRHTLYAGCRTVPVFSVPQRVRRLSGYIRAWSISFCCAWNRDGDNPIDAESVSVRFPWSRLPGTM